MKPIEEIKNTQSFKNQAFIKAIISLIKDDISTPSLYHDSIYNSIMIYKLDLAKSFKSNQQEVILKDLPTYIESISNQQVKDKLNEVYNKLIVVMNTFEFDNDYNETFSQTISNYGCNSPSEMWENSDFTRTINELSNKICVQLQPIQDIIINL